MVYIVFVSMLVALTVVAVFAPRIPAALVGYAAMWLCKIGGIGAFSGATMAFWGIATALVLGLGVLLPHKVTSSRAGVSYMAIGAVTGMVLGLISNAMAGIILGAACGVFFGSLVYSRTAAGREILHFPSAQYFNYLAAKGIRMVVALSMAGACLIQLIYPLTLV